MRGLLVIIFVSTGLCLLCGLKIRQAVPDDIYILSMQDDSRFFHVSDLVCVRKGNIDAAFEQRVAAEVSNGFRVEDISVSATNENFGYFTKMQILQGAFFNEIQVGRKYRLAVINESAAYQLFGSEDCVAQEIFLNRVSFQVIGIVKEQGDEAEAKIYIPYTVLEDMGAELSVGQLWCRFGNLAEAALILGWMGCSLKEVNIVQTNNLKGLFMQRFWILVILIDFCFMTYLLSVFIRQKERFQRKLSLSFGLLFGLAVGIGIAFKAVRLAAYIPPAYELSRESWRTVVCSLFDFYLLADINISYLPFLHYWNMFSLSMFVICLVSGAAVSSRVFHQKD